MMDKLKQLVKTNRLVRVGLVILGVVLFIVLVATCSSGGSSRDGSLGEAEIKCERAIEQELGSSADVEYTTKTEQGAGKFALYGTVTTPYGGSKFHCSVTGAMGDGDGVATLELYD